jgi:hypothetical protein
MGGRTIRDETKFMWRGKRCDQLSNASSNAAMDRLAEMSCRRYGIKRAVRGWTGWHHHITIVLLAMLMHLKWKDKAPMLMIQDVRAIPEMIVPKRRITKRDIREFFFFGIM